MNYALIADLWRTGMNTGEIATALNLREHEVYNVLDIIRHVARDEEPQQEALEL